MRVKCLTVYWGAWVGGYDEWLGSDWSTLDSSYCDCHNYNNSCGKAMLVEAEVKEAQVQDGYSRGDLTGVLG